MKNTPSVETLAARYAALSAAGGMTQEELAEQLHAEVWRRDWAEVLRLLTLWPEEVPHAQATECLVRAVHSAPPEVFSRLLERLPSGEYAEKDTYPVNWSPTGESFSRRKWEVGVQGTLVMHAVAENRPEILRLLLEHGHDVNSASAAAAGTLLQDFGDRVINYGRRYIPFRPYTARPESSIMLLRWDTAPDDIPSLCWEGATPLALAILMGHRECARILVEHGAWLEEAPSVSSAMYLFWREKDPSYQAARGVVLAEREHASHRPVLWAVGETASPKQLKSVLESYAYSREELTQAAEKMLETFSHQRELWKSYEDGWTDLCSRLYRIGRYCPEALCAPEVIGGLLDHALSWKAVSMGSLLTLLEGRRLDLSAMRTGLYDLDRPGARQLFELLAAQCRLVMERDAVPRGLPEQVTSLLIRHVTFLPTAVPQGISALTLRILETGNLRLIRKSLKTGLIPPEESAEELLRCQRERKLPPVCRSALLTTHRPSAQKTEKKTPLPGNLRNRWFSDIVQNGAMPILTEADWQRWFWQSLTHPYGSRMVTASGEKWEVNSTFLAVCMEGREDIARMWLAHITDAELRNTQGIWCEERGIRMVVTPLCAAAFAGQGAVVEQLLRRGASAREELCGSPGVWSERWMEEGERCLPINPVLAAALGDHWDTVNLLLEHGAVCFWDAPEVRYIWSRFRTDDPAVAAKKMLGGGE